MALAGCDVVFGLERDPPKPDAPTPAGSWQQVSGGHYHTCGIRLDHTLWCWGRNDDGQLGARTGPADWEVAEPRQVGTDGDWERLSARDNSTCAIKADHRLYCWGDNLWGELGVGDTKPRDVPTQVEGTWTSVVLGTQHACAIDKDSQIWCWGDNTFSELGTGTASGSTTSPVLVAAAGPWADVAAGAWHTCARKADDGRIWCWGNNSYGQTATPGVSPVIVPAVTGATRYTKVVAAQYATCGLEPAGTIDCWGNNTVGEVGDGTGINQASPAPVGQDQITDFVDVAAGLRHVCAIRAGGELWCWGSNEHGQLIDAQHAFRSVPTVVAGTWSAIAGVGDRTTCVLDADHHLSCAGYGPGGGLGTGIGSERSPTPLEATWDQISAGWNATCGRRGTTIGCWGANAHGTVGDTTFDDRQVPVLLSGTWASVMVAEHGCALDTTSHLWCWGLNNLGQLGKGDQADKPQPTLVGDLTSMWSSAAVSFHTSAIDLTGSMYSWGSNAYGEAGLPAISNPVVLTPQKPHAVTWKAVSAGDYHTCGITSARSIACWGYNGEGQLGATSAPTEVPQNVVVPGNPTFDAITSGERFTCARTAGAVWCWGSNAFGQLGNQTTVMSVTPIRLPGTWKEISAGQWHACGIQIDGSLWCWGQNRWGQLGVGTLFEQHEPVQVGTDTDWTSVSAGKHHTCARKASGAVSCWGGNTGGELGTGRAWRATLEEIAK